MLNPLTAPYYISAQQKRLNQNNQNPLSGPDYLIPLSWLKWNDGKSHVLNIRDIRRVEERKCICPKSLIQISHCLLLCDNNTWARDDWLTGTEHQPLAGKLQDVHVEICKCKCYWLFILKGQWSRNNFRLFLSIMLQKTLWKMCSLVSFSSNKILATR